MAKQKIIWEPHPGPQTEFLSRGEDEVLYGGARGGGKSEAALMGALRHVRHPDYRAIFFRRSFPQIQDLIDRARQKYRLFAPAAEWKEGKHRFVFPSGAMISFSHMETELSGEDHRGKEYHYICFEELTYFSFKQYSDLLTCSRSSVKELIPKVASTTNPGGPGHIWVKDYFIDPSPPGTTIFNKMTGLSRVFIPAKVWDNPTLIANDPRYILKLKALPERERRMQLEGEWDIFEGQALTEWDNSIHRVPHRVPSQETVKFIAIDWGYTKPFSIGWYELDPYDRLYKYREWYGVQHDEEGRVRSNVGIQKDITDVAIGLVQRTKEEISYIVADPAMWAKHGHTGGSIATTLVSKLPRGWSVLRGDNDRIQGKNQVHSRLRIRADGRPALEISENCRHTLRTVPGLPVSQTNVEDIDTKSEDHAYDELRYACMSQPMTDYVVYGSNGTTKSVCEIESFRKMRVPKKEERLVDSYA